MPVSFRLLQALKLKTCSSFHTLKLTEDASILDGGSDELKKKLRRRENKNWTKDTVADPLGSVTCGLSGSVM